MIGILQNRNLDEKQMNEIMEWHLGVVKKILKGFRAKLLCGRTIQQLEKDLGNTTIEEIEKDILKVIRNENFDFGCDCGIFVVGELKFQKLVKYHLKPNAIFHDGIHEFMLSYQEFARKNKELLEEVKLEHLYLVMPSNKKWMDRAKAGGILAQAIFKKANIESIIPSDLNIIDIET